MKRIGTREPDDAEVRRDPLPDRGYGFLYVLD